MSRGDLRILATGVVIAITALVSFVDPGGSWGGIMLVSVLAGLGAAVLAIQSPGPLAARLPASKGTALLVLGAAATAASTIALLSYVGYVLGNLADIFEIVFLVGLVASIVLLRIGWAAYRAEGGASANLPTT